MGNIIYTNDFVFSQKFGSLKPIKEFYKICSKRKKRFFLCKCDCGKLSKVSFEHLNLGKIKSCGCSKTNQHFKKHGLTNHILYPVWIGMKQRCYNKNKDRYKDWGGRGIIVCDEWKEDFLIFYNWCLKNGYKKGLQIDRINNDGNYEPTNCRFVTPKINSNNRRRGKQKKM